MSELNNELNHGQCSQIQTEWRNRISYKISNLSLNTFRSNRFHTQEIQHW